MLALGSNNERMVASGLANPYWEFVFEDLGKIFFMTPDPNWWGTPRDVSEERMQIRSGLYYNVYPLVNIFYFDGYYRPNEAFFSECGTFLAGVKTEAPWGPNECQQLVGIYKNGVLVRNYQVEYFFEEPDGTRYIPPTTAGIFWDVWEDRTFDPLTNILTIVTRTTAVIGERHTFTFDITTYDSALDTTTSIPITSDAFNNCKGALVLLSTMFIAVACFLILFKRRLSRNI